MARNYGHDADMDNCEKKTITTTLTIYTDLYDSKENVIGTGMSGKVFLDKSNGTGQEFKTVDSALEWTWDNNVDIDRIEICYLNSNDDQMVRRFTVAVNGK